MFEQSVTFAQAIEGSWVNLPSEGKLLVDGEKGHLSKPADDNNAGRKNATQPWSSLPPQTNRHHGEAHLHSIYRLLD